MIRHHNLWKFLVNSFWKFLKNVFCKFVGNFLIKNLVKILVSPIELEALFLHQYSAWTPQLVFVQNRAWNSQFYVG